MAMRVVFSLICILWFASPTVGEGPRTAQPAAPLEQKADFTFPTPENWQTETIPFPLDFAPGLSYQGTEELRFSPGFFKRESADFWSYAFVWHLQGEVSLTALVLKRDLETYFEGLSRAVEKPENYDESRAAARVKFSAAPSDHKDRTAFIGTVATYDAFVTHGRVHLNARVEVLRCAATGYTAALFQLSPQPWEHAIWKSLNRIRAGFEC